MLEEYGLTVFLPARDTDQGGSDKDIFRSNLKGIRESRVLLAVFSNAGSNLSFELGFATGIGRPIFGLMKEPQEVPDLMLRKCLRECSADETTVVSSLCNYLKNDASMSHAIDS